MESPSCRNCKLRFELRKSDYSKGGCEHTVMSGFICMAFANEGIAEWMYGVDEEGMCECFTPKDDQKHRKVSEANGQGEGYQGN